MRFQLFLYAFISLLSAHGIDARAENELLGGSKESLEAYVKAHAQPFDLTLLAGGPRVVYLAERHSEPISKNFLISQMGKLKELGFTHLALEMFDSREQKLLDRFVTSTGAQEKGVAQLILTYLEMNWGHIPDYYMRVVEAAKAQDLKLIALDYRPENSIVVDKRDVRMAKTLAKTLKRSPQSKILVLIGCDHVDSKINDFMVEFQPDILKKNHGIDSLTLNIAAKYDVGSTLRAKPGTNVDIRDFRSDNPNLIHELHYMPVDSPLRESFQKLQISTSGTFLPTVRADSGFDGFIFIDQYDEKVNDPEIIYRERKTPAIDDPEISIEETQDVAPKVPEDS